MELSQKILGEHFYCIFARIVKKQNLEKTFFVKIYFCDVTKKNSQFFSKFCFFTIRAKMQ